MGKKNDEEMATPSNTLEIPDPPIPVESEASAATPIASKSPSQSSRPLNRPVLLVIGISNIQKDSMNVLTTTNCWATQQ